MSTHLSSVLHLLFIISFAALLLGVVCAIMDHAFIRWTSKFEAQSRLMLLRGYCATPFFGALVIGAMISIPAISHTSVLLLDHCHDNKCFGPAASHMSTTGELVIIAVAFCLLLIGITTAFLQWRRSRHLLRELNSAPLSALSPNVQIIDTALPFAFSLGIFNPKAVVSTRLMDELTPMQQYIVCAHETAHIQQRDGLYKWGLSFMCSFHWPSARLSLLNEHATVSEIRADHYVADIIQNKLAVAETIVKVQRLMRPIAPDEPLCQFLGSQIEQRVQILLANSSGYEIPRRIVFSVYLFFLAFAVCGSVPLHNAIESLITH